MQQEGLLYPLNGGRPYLVERRLMKDDLEDQGDRGEGGVGLRQAPEEPDALIIRQVCVVTTFGNEHQS